jgi:hypothetical protein
MTTLTTQSICNLKISPNFKTRTIPQQITMTSLLQLITLIMIQSMGHRSMFKKKTLKPQLLLLIGRLIKITLLNKILIRFKLRKLRLKKMRLKQLRLKQLRLKQLRLKQLRLKQLRLKKMRLKKLKLKQPKLKHPKLR